MTPSHGRESNGGALPRHYLKPCLLLLLAEGPSHGYDLLEQVRRLGIRGAEPGGLYRYLRAMEKEELVSSWWEPSQAGPARRTYVLTDQGRRALEQSVSSLRDVREILVSLLDRYDGLTRETRAARG
ncbi:MAG: PadR family transcriptional regulator [Actinomycetota bacterium]|nr:PadR family transcriptional regulator [Actinomycetota bacterium]